MSKTIAVALQTHIAGHDTTLCTCLKLTRTDGTVIRLTTNNKDVVVPADGTYLARPGFNHSAIPNTAGLTVDTVDLEGFFHASGISEADARAGRFDNCAARLFKVNWKTPSQGVIKLRGGWLGQIVIEGQRWQAEHRSMAYPLQQVIGEKLTQNCRYNLGDARCQLDLTPFTDTGVVSSVTGNRIFSAAAGSPALSDSDAYYQHGVLTWQTGDNVGLSMEVKDYTSGGSPPFGFELMLAMPFDIHVGDEFDVVAGCNKTPTHCKDKFDNKINYGGFDFIRPDAALKYAKPS